MLVSLWPLWWHFVQPILPINMSKGILGDLQKQQGQALQFLWHFQEAFHLQQSPVGIEMPGLIYWILLTVSQELVSST